MKEKILLIGAGQHARVILYNIKEQNKKRCINNALKIFIK